MSFDIHKFLVYNLLPEAVITPSSVDAQYPASNLVDDRRTKTFRSTSNDTSIVLDFGTARAMDCLLMVDSGISSFGFITATIELNTSNTWVTPAYTQSVTIDSDNGFAYAEFSSKQTYRYARLVLTNTAGYCEVSKFFIGEAVDLGDIGFNYPVKFNKGTNATVQKNRLGQRFIDEINSQKTLSGSINNLTPDELDKVLEITDYASFTKPIWVYFPSNQSHLINNPNRLSGYYYLKDDPDDTLSAGNYWSLSFQLEEGT